MTAATPAPLPAGPPGAPPAERFRRAYYARAETDYYFDGLGMVIFLTIITCGIYGFYVTYQLVPRSRDHNPRRRHRDRVATGVRARHRGGAPPQLRAHRARSRRAAADDDRLPRPGHLG